MVDEGKLGFGIYNQNNLNANAESQSNFYLYFKSKTTTTKIKIDDTVASQQYKSPPLECQKSVCLFLSVSDTKLQRTEETIS